MSFVRTDAQEAGNLPARLVDLICILFLQESRTCSVVLEQDTSYISVVTDQIRLPD
jgi:hypothetical protein